MSLDKDGKLVVKHALTGFRAFGGAGRAGPGALPPAPPGGAVPGPAVRPQPGGGGAIVGPANVQMVTTIQTQTVSLDDVQILDTKGNKVDKKELPKLLKEETVAMASLYGQAVDPLHLRVLKDGTLTFVLPAPKAVNPGNRGGGGFGPGAQRRTHPTASGPSSGCGASGSAGSGRGSAGHRGAGNPGHAARTADCGARTPKP